MSSGKLSMQASARADTRTLSLNRILHSISRAMPAIVFLGPAVTAFMLFKYYPLYRGLVMSFYRWDIINPPGQYIGFENFVNTLSSDHFFLLLKNTLALFAYGILLGFWVPIAQAVVLNHIRTGYSAFRFLFVLPVAVPSVAFLMVWTFIWSVDGGLANVIMGLLGLPRQSWIGDPALVKLCLRIPGLLGQGVGILIYLAAIQNIPEEVIEAAIVDGANAWQRIWRIILPSIMPIVNVMFIISLTQSLLAFEDVWIMTQGGPGYASSTLVIGVYQRAFVQSQYGVGSAWAVLILLMTLAFTAIRLRFVQDERF
jgi:multiple sugar transport system permease protein